MERSCGVAAATRVVVEDVPAPWGWSDVSDEVAREIAVIWESEYGADWRETLCNHW